MLLPKISCSATNITNHISDIKITKDKTQAYITLCEFVHLITHHTTTTQITLTIYMARTKQITF